eukprot:TRINITY_DN17989_c0_g1_i1.p1 TRINITY_DN17989_c0_g1~~TRINITY_DN17989_c0_g1_i1.p1  ORF type:complete len:433 (+),score=155.53 TRINITY_DN17989_c0_g1_i1:42-1340(+)
MWSPAHSQDYASPGLVDGQVRSALVAEQADAYDTLKATVDTWDLTEEQRAWCHEGTLCRYLRARKWDPKAAAEMLEGTIKWRAETQPGAITYDTVADQADFLSNYLWGFDAAGHVICYMRVSRDPPGDADEKMKFVIHNIEEATRWLDAHAHLFRGVERMSYVIDLKGFTMANSVRDMKVCKEWLSVLGNHQPERLHKAYLMNYPGAFKVFFGMLKPFIDPVTKAKVNWVPPAELAETRQYFINEGMEMAWLEKDVGGDLDMCKLPNVMTNPDYKPFFSYVKPPMNPYHWIMVAAAVAIAEAALVTPPPPRELERRASDVSIHFHTMREDDGVVSEDEGTDASSAAGVVAVPVPRVPCVAVRKPTGELVVVEVDRYTCVRGVCEQHGGDADAVFLAHQGRRMEPTERLYQYHEQERLVLELHYLPRGCCAIM